MQTQALLTAVLESGAAATTTFAVTDFTAHLVRNLVSLELLYTITNFTITDVMYELLWTP